MSPIDDLARALAASASRRRFEQGVVGIFDGLPPGAGAEIARQMTRSARDRRTGAPPTKRLRDGSTGYYMRRHDDCWQAAVATVLQVPIRELPDSRIDERLRAGESAEEITRSADEEMERWLADRSLRASVHTDVPLDEERWLGYVPVLGAFQSHCLVMARDQLLFDPAMALEPPVGKKVRFWGVDDVRLGVTFSAEAGSS